MDETITNPYDKAARYGIKGWPTDWYGWHIGPGTPFGGWLDTRNIPAPASADRTADTIARFRDPSTGRDWAVVVEFKLEPDPDVFGQVRAYEAYLWTAERPAPGIRYRVGSMVINLRGRQGQLPEESLAGSPVRQGGGPWVINMSEFDAPTILTAIEGGQLGPGVLPWVSLMQGAGESDIITRWKQAVGRVADRAERSNMAAIAMVFAEAAGRKAVWADELRGWDMVESVVVNEWMRYHHDKGRMEGRDEGRVEGFDIGELAGQIRLLQRQLHLPQTPRAELAEWPLERLKQTVDELSARIGPQLNGKSGG